MQCLKEFLANHVFEGEIKNSSGRRKILFFFYQFYVLLCGIYKTHFFIKIFFLSLSFIKEATRLNVRIL